MRTTGPNSRLFLETRPIFKTEIKYFITNLTWMLISRQVTHYYLGLIQEAIRCYTKPLGIAQEHLPLLFLKQIYFPRRIYILPRIVDVTAGPSRCRKTPYCCGCPSCHYWRVCSVVAIT